ncbi:MAG: LacI family DNA-binding transcriptional regulator [Clostridia bacterium]|nr:LacI family DNA-binding transcriptional regulator [Clostridia bacterium]
MSTVTIYTLAKELHMTPSMVSRAFNPEARIDEEKRQIVLAAAKKYNYTPNRFASRLSMKTVRIGILINSRFLVNTDKMTAGIRNAYDKLKDYKITYDITLMNPLTHKMDDYRTVLDRYRDYDGVILTGMSSTKYTDIINTVYKRTPAVVQVQAINREADYLFASKHNEETASFLAAEFLSNCLTVAKRKNILLFTGDSESALHADASTAFDKACLQFGLTLADSIDMKDNEAYFEEILPSIFEKWNDRIDGIYITSGLSAPLSRYLEKHEIHLPFVAFDTYDEIKQYLEKGIISATIAQNVAHQMELAFDGLIKHLITGETCPKTVYTDVQLVLKSNMHQFN